MPRNMSDDCYSHSEATIQSCLNQIQTTFPKSIKFAAYKNGVIVFHLKLSTKAAEFEEWAMQFTKASRVSVRNDKNSMGVRNKGKKFKGAWPLVWMTPPRDLTDAEMKAYFELIQTWPYFHSNQLQQQHSNLYRKRISPESVM